MSALKSRDVEVVVYCSPSKSQTLRRVNPIRRVPERPREDKVVFFYGANIHSSVFRRYPEAPGGCAYDRWHAYPDWVMDTWHPYEKAMYPKYFATREKRKLEYIENFERLKATWPKEETADGHH